MSFPRMAYPKIPARAMRDVATSSAGHLTPLRFRIGLSSLSSSKFVIDTFWFRNPMLGQEIPQLRDNPPVDAQ
jgi:hypothetical protein